MAIVHIHIERTGGVSLQDLYEKKYPGPEMLWYSARDELFAPFNIKTANYTKDWQLKVYAFIARWLPGIRHLLLRIRTWRRKRHAVSLENLPHAEVVIGHFAVHKVLPILPPAQHTYRTIVRDPLARMWSHFNHFSTHKGDVGHRVVPQFRGGMTFEEFALLPEMHNYQTQAIGDDLSIFEYIGVTEKLDDFSRAVGLLGQDAASPTVNHFGNKMPSLTSEFMRSFKEAHAKDYELYESILTRWSR